MVDISTKGRARLRQKGQALPGKDGGADRFPIGGRGPGPGTLAAAISAVGRAKPNTPEERAKVRRYIMRVAAKKGWSADIPDSWNPDGTLKGGGS